MLRLDQQQSTRWENSEKFKKWFSYSKGLKILQQTTHTHCSPQCAPPQSDSLPYPCPKVTALIKTYLRSSSIILFQQTLAGPYFVQILCWESVTNSPQKSSRIRTSGYSRPLREETSISTYFLKICHGNRNSTVSTESPGVYKTAHGLRFPVTILSLSSIISTNKSSL